MKRKTISIEVDRWITEQELPTRPFLKRISQYDDLYPEDPDEYEAYCDFISWYLSLDYLPLTIIPAVATEKFVIEVDEFGNNVTAFNTVDYLRLNPFSKYHYRIKKMYERVKQLAIAFSTNSTREGKEIAIERFKQLINSEFRDKVIEILRTLTINPEHPKKNDLLEKIQDYNAKIRRCRQIWDQETGS